MIFLVFFCSGSVCSGFVTKAVVLFEGMRSVEVSRCGESAGGLIVADPSAADP